jgi:cell wall-associated NlpC family hydrolase
VTVGSVTARISELQSQLAMLSQGVSPVSTGASSRTAVTAGADATAGTDFASALDTATGTQAGTDAGSDGTAVVAEAKKFLGLPYVWGGNSPTKGVDCSGLVQQVYKHFGIELPRLSADQARSGRPVASMAEAKPGDLLAWNNSSRNNGADHIAIYAGNGKMIEAPRTGLNVRLVDVPSTPDYIRRILPPSSAGSVVAARAATGVSASGGGVSGVPFSDLFNRAGAKYGVSPALLSAVARQESGYDPKAVSGAGAQGLMQLMPGTARGLGVTNSFDPTQAVDGAARMLRDLTNRFGSTELALAAYNAGPGAVLKYHGIPPYAETQKYVRNVMSHVGRAA